MVMIIIFIIDVDECADGNNGFCDQYCNNTNGSYHCECDVIGYVLDEDGRGCSGMFLNQTLQL